jgi:serine protease Do
VHISNEHPATRSDVTLATRLGALVVAVWLGLGCSNTAANPRHDALPPAADPSSEVTRLPPSPADFSRRFVDVAKTVGPAVVAVTSTSTRDVELPFSGTPFDFFFRGPQSETFRQRRQGIGSGTIVDRRGYVLTNNHVVADTDEIKVVMSDDRELRAELVGGDPNTDIAVIKISHAKELGDLQPATLGRSDALQVGQWVVAIGSPFGLKQTISAGIISAVGRGRMGIADYEDFIQTDAAVNPGNSGGPLVDLEGAVIGINTAIASQTGGYQGVGFAVPIDMARAVMDQLIANGKVVRGYLGVFVTDVTPELARSFDYGGKGGVLVQDVSAGAPAAKASLRPGDIITTRDGKAVTGVVAFRNSIAQTKPGTKTAFGVFRSGKEQRLEVTLDELRSDEPEKVGEGSKRRAASHSGRGVSLQDLDAELARRLDVPSNQGAVVVAVDPDSQAGRSGLRTGDVIVEVGPDAVHSAAEADRLLAKSSARNPVRLRVLREGRGMFVVLSPDD